MTKNYLLQYEIGVKWLILCINVGYQEVIDTAPEFLSKMGRMKYIRPVY